MRFGLMNESVLGEDLGEEEKRRLEVATLIVSNVVTKTSSTADILKE